MIFDMRQEEKMIEKPVPKSTQILQDWVSAVESSARNASNVLHAKTVKNNIYQTDSEKIDRAADYVGEILGQCQIMRAVLQNSN